MRYSLSIHFCHCDYTDSLNEELNICALANPGPVKTFIFMLNVAFHLPAPLDSYG